MGLTHLSRFDLETLSAKTGFDVTALEKVAHLQQILAVVNQDPFLAPRLILKGGTALNLYYLDVPRLSVDLDFNYIGSANRQIMLSERPEIENRLTQAIAHLGLEKERFGHRHAGGKTSWRYPSVFGHRGTIEIDLNYMHRVHFHPTVRKTTSLDWFGFNEPVHLQDIHEVAAGKIMALQSRDKSRDIFDAALLSDYPLDKETLRLYTVLYIAMDGKALSELRGLINTTEKNDFRQQLRPLLTAKHIGRMKEAEYIDSLVSGANRLLSAIFPLREPEKAFLADIKQGQIKPDYLTGDPALQSKIRSHPGIGWHAHGKRDYVAARFPSDGNELASTPVKTADNGPDSAFWQSALIEAELKLLSHQKHPEIKSLLRLYELGKQKNFSPVVVKSLNDVLEKWRDNPQLMAALKEKAQGLAQGVEKRVGEATREREHR